LFSKEQLRPDVQWLRGEWLGYIPYIDVNRLVFLDETSVNIGMTRLYGRSLKGVRIIEYVPYVKYKRVSILSTIRVNGESNPFVYSGTLNGNLFMQYIWECVVPKLKPYDILVMDCLSSHKMKIISEMVESAGANVLYLPPYSPDFNPIETIFSQIKSDFREHKPRDIESICDVVTYAFYSITPEQSQNQFRNAFCNV
jgi:transposase